MPQPRIAQQCSSCKRVVKVVGNEFIKGKPQNKVQRVEPHLADARIRPLVHSEAEDVGRVRDRQLAVDAP